MVSSFQIGRKVVVHDVVEEIVLLRDGKSFQLVEVIPSSEGCNPFSEFRRVHLQAEDWWLESVFNPGDRIGGSWRSLLLRLGMLRLELRLVDEG